MSLYILPAKFHLKAVECLRRLSLKRLAAAFLPFMRSALRMLFRVSLLKALIRVIRISFISGPWMMLTGTLGLKNSALMILLCIPSLLFCGMLTLPGMLFQSPQQGAYFHFSRILEQDPSRWLILALASVCVVMALALPACSQKPSESRAS
jgi:hypothetical protein